MIRYGVYRFIRHPSYLGQLVMMGVVGMMMSDYTAMMVAPVPLLLAFINRIIIEERALVEHFGDEYREYRKSSWRLFPPAW